MGIFKLVRLSTQVGLAGATVYCANEFNLFGDHGQATGGYQELKETVRTNEYYKEYAGPIVSEASQSAATTLAPGMAAKFNFAQSSQKLSLLRLGEFRMHRVDCEKASRKIERVIIPA